MGGRPDQPGDAVPVQPGQADVDEHDVGLQAERQLDARRPVGGFAHLVPGQLQQRTEAIACIGVVLDRQHAPTNGFGRRELRGFHRGMGRRGERQADREDTATPRSVTGHVDLPAVQIGQAAHERQADAHSSLRPIRLAVPLDEEIEDPGHQLRGNTDAGVLDPEDALVSLRSRDHPDAASRRRVLERVQEQVHDDLLQPCRVGVDPGRLQLHLELVALQPLRCIQRSEARRNAIDEVHRSSLKRDLARGDPGHVEQIVHHPGQAIDLAGDDRPGRGGPIGIVARRARELAPRSRSPPAGSAARVRASPGTRPWPDSPIPPCRRPRWPRPPPACDPTREPPWPGPSPTWSPGRAATAARRCCENRSSKGRNLSASPTSRTSTAGRWRWPSRAARIETPPTAAAAGRGNPGGSCQTSTSARRRRPRRGRARPGGQRPR